MGYTILNSIALGFSSSPNVRRTFSVHVKPIKIKLQAIKNDSNNTIDAVTEQSVFFIKKITLGKWLYSFERILPWRFLEPRLVLDIHRWLSESLHGGHATASDESGILVSSASGTSGTPRAAADGDVTGPSTGSVDYRSSAACRSRRKRSSECSRGTAQVRGCIVYALSSEPIHCFCKKKDIFKTLFELQQ